MQRLERTTGHLLPKYGRSAADRHPKLPMVIKDEVARALRANQAVIALESTIISHGMPYPQNLETALQVESVARQHGAVPATIAILDGTIHVGLEKEDLQKLAQLGPKCRKVSRRDLALTLAERANGATTVAATMYIAHLAGIRIFVTGGIGGVHRGVEETMDISADLTELGRTPVTVFCAGVKSILDIPRTLEFLETQGVSVATLGSKIFPAFFTPDSGCASPHVFDSVQQVARAMHSGSLLGLESGMIVAVPIPANQAAENEHVEKATQQALTEAKQKHIQGRDMTPFLLKRINEITGGESLRSNIALIKNNCKMGALTAVALSRLTSIAPPVVVGAVNEDLLGRPLAGQPVRQRTSNPGTLTRVWGGVGRNIAESLARLKLEPLFVSIVGNDSSGQAFVRHASDIGINTSAVTISKTNKPTSTYMAILDQYGDTQTTIAAMDIVEELQPDLIKPLEKQLLEAPFVVLDANIPQTTIEYVCHICASAATPVPVWFEPVSFVKAVKCLKPLIQGQIKCISPTYSELVAIVQALGSTIGPRPAEEAITDVPHLKSLLEDLFRLSKPQHVILKRGALGAIYAHGKPSGALLLPAFPVAKVMKTSGAGDTLVGATIFGLLQTGGDWVNSVLLGMRAASMTVASANSVSDVLSPASLLSDMQQVEQLRAKVHQV